MKRGGQMLTGPVPMLWPELIDWGGEGWGNPLPELLQGISELYGVVCGIDQQGVSLVKNLLTVNPDARCSLAVAVFPECPTKQADLFQLFDLQTTGPKRIAFGVVSMDLRGGLPPTLLYAKSQRVPEGFVAVGGTPNFGIASQEVGHGNLVFTPDILLMDRWCSWFQQTWQSCHPLTETACLVPERAPFGNLSLEEAWQAYNTMLGDEHFRESMKAAEESSAEVTSEAPPEGPYVPPEPTRPDPLLVRLARTYEMGDQVCLDRSRRLPPFSLPLRPELFGLQRSRRMDVVKRSLSYSITPFDSAVGDDLNRFRRSQALLMGKLGFLLGDNRYWIPHTARPLLQAELNRLNDAGQTQLKQTVGDVPMAFVEAQRQRIVDSLAKAYQEFRPGATLPDEAVERVMGQVAAKVEGAIGKNILAPLKSSPIRLSQLGDTLWASPWSEAYGLLRRIAEFPRRVLSRPGFLGDFHLTQDLVLSVMDVCGDHILDRSLQRRSGEASYELKLLQVIDDADVDDRAKCSAVLELIDSGNAKAVLAIVDPASTENNG